MKYILVLKSISQLLGRLGTVYSTVWCTVQCTDQCTVNGKSDSSVHYRYVGCPDTHRVVTSKSVKTKCLYVFSKWLYTNEPIFSNSTIRPGYKRNLCFKVPQF